MNDTKTNYDSSEFISRLQEKTKGRLLPNCPFCGSADYYTPPEMANIFLTKDFNGLQIGPSVPSAMIICKTCGHIDFFAIGMLGMIPPKQEKSEEK